MAKKSFADLVELKNSLAHQAELAAQKAAEDARVARLQALEARVFLDALDGVKPLVVAARVSPPKIPVEPRAAQFERDERAALWQTLSDDMDIERLLDTDAALSYRRPGIGEDVTRKLRKGFWVVQDQIDLHGLRVEQAREAIANFFLQADKRSLRCLRIIHGKGLGSINREPILKEKVLRWLVQREEVIAFCQARPNDGGAGALIVLLNASNQLR